MLKEAANICDGRAVVIGTTERTVVGHVPQEIAETLWYFLGHGGNITCEVIGHRRRVNGLEVPCQYRLQVNEKNSSKSKTTPRNVQFSELCIMCNKYQEVQ